MHDNKFGIMVVGCAITIAILSKLTFRQSTKYSTTFMKQIHRILSQCNQLYKMSMQDTDPLVQLMHINSAISYLNAVRVIVNDNTIQSITSRNISDYISRLETHQQNILSHISSQCPSLQPRGIYQEKTTWH